MHTIIKSVLFAVALAASAGAAAASIVNIDARALDGITVQLTPGTYRFSFIGIADGGSYDAYGLWTHQYPYTDPRTNSHCQNGVAQCRYGYQHVFHTVIDGTATVYRLAADQTPPLPNYTRFATIAAALAAVRSGPYTQPLEFTLAGPTPVVFKVGDPSWWDNEGGVSIMLTAVPEPGGWALIATGLAVVGSATRRRRRRTIAA